MVKIVKTVYRYVPYASHVQITIYLSIYDLKIIH